MIVRGSRLNCIYCALNKWTSIDFYLTKTKVLRVQTLHIEHIMFEFC